MTDQRIPQVGEVWRHVSDHTVRREILAVVHKNETTLVVTWTDSNNSSFMFKLNAFLETHEPVPTIPPVPERFQATWMNVYPQGSTIVHDSREDADEADSGRIALVRWDGWDEDGKLLGEVVQ